MSKLHAQMALLGTIDEVAVHANNPDTVRLIEEFLPGTTAIGQQGWYRELKHFLSRKELRPRAEDGSVIERDGPVTFPSLADAIDELRTDAAPEDRPSPAVRSRTLFAATILSKAAELEKDWNPRGAHHESPLEIAPDALDALLPVIAPGVKGSKIPTRGLGKSTASTGDPIEDLKISLRSTTSRGDYLSYTRAIANARDAAMDSETKDVMKRPVVCTGSLREIDGKFATVLTTNWDPPLRLSQIAELIDPHNWPLLCDFFVSMKDQDPIDPDRSRGWARILESVSGDETQWQMHTALRFWNGASKPGDGIFVNYDLDEPRVDDCGLLEVDAGYLWATPINGTGPDPVVKIRTSKQVRIRGVSATATAALACGFGWGDAMSQMFTSGVDAAPDGRVALTAFAPSKETAAPAADANQSALQRPVGGEQSDAEIAADAEKVELPTGWRKAIIEAMRLQMTQGIDTAATLGSDFAVRWSDGEGFSLEDVKAFGGRFGTELTDYATGVFKEAAAALQPQSDGAAPGGND